MCIIVYHPKEAKQITKKTLKICFKNNDDGAGYTYWDTEKKKWIVKKGFMKWTPFWNSFKTHQFQKNDRWAAHFRIATSGNTDGGNTHPFPVTDNYEEMRQTEFETKIITFHNGVMGSGEDNVSDTMKHIKRCLYPMRTQLTNNKFKYIMEKLCSISSNRWLIANTKTALLLGDWKEHEGSYFSNSSYEKLKWSITQNHNNQQNTFATGYNHGGAYPHSPLWDSKEEENRRNWHDYYNGNGKFNQDDGSNGFNKCVACGDEDFQGPSMFSEFKQRCFRCGCVYDPVTEKVSFFVPAEYKKGV